MAQHSQASNAILGIKLRYLHPDLAQELERKPRLADTSLIPQIIKSHYRPDDDRMIFMGAIINLYDPDVVGGWKRNLCRGIRSQMSELFKVSPTAISNNVTAIQNYMMIYKKFNDGVERLSNEIAEIYCKK